MTTAANHPSRLLWMSFLALSTMLVVAAASPLLAAAAQIVA